MIPAWTACRDRRLTPESRPISQDDSSRLAEPDPRLRVSVIVPARNEARYLLGTLRSLTQQRDAEGETLDPRAFEVIVLANNCTDETAWLAREFAREHTAIHVIERTFTRNVAHIGTARRWLMDLACHRLESVGNPLSLIASTDADTAVGPGWVAANVAEAAAGADAVAGIIQVNYAELRKLGREVRRAYWLDRIYRRLKLELEALIDPNPLDPYPRHDFHGGASLAITPRMYRRVGGLPPLASQEDVALAEALWRVDARFVHSPRVRVVTSSRLLGRATGGQSQTLARWGLAEEDRVDDADAVELELMTRRRLRQLFRSKIDAGAGPWSPNPLDLTELPTKLRMKAEPLAYLLASGATFGGWLETIKSISSQNSGQTHWVKVPISDAIAGLRCRLRSVVPIESAPLAPKGPSDTWV